MELKSTQVPEAIQNSSCVLAVMRTSARRFAISLVGQLVRSYLKKTLIGIQANLSSHVAPICNFSGLFR